MHVGLISLYATEANAIRYMAALLRSKGIKVTEVYFKDWVNNYLSLASEKEYRLLIDLLKKRKVDLIGMGIRASAFVELSKDMTLRLRKELKAPIIWGGIHVSSCPDECIAVADAVCLGEGEFAFLEFVEKFSRNRGRLPEDVLNFWVRDNGKIVKNPLRPLISDLDTLPFKDFHSQEDKFSINNNRIVKGDPSLSEPRYRVLTSRGCVYGKCSFCINTMMNKIYPPRGYYYRLRSVKNIMDELNYVLSHLKKVKEIRFDDEMFSLKDDWIDEFCREYQKIAIPFEIQLHPSFIKIEHLRKLKKVGLKTVCVGIQNTERINQCLYNRRGTNQEIINIAKQFRDLNFKVCYQVILDDPVSSEDDKRELFNLLMSLPRPFELYLFSLTYIPGTAVTDNLLQQKVISQNQVEGVSKKLFYQYRVDLAYPRNRRDTFWAALIVLVSKRFIPKGMIWRVSQSRFLQGHPLPLVLFAQACNFIKMAGVAFSMLLRGQLNMNICKRWLNLKSLITQ